VERIKELLTLTVGILIPVIFLGAVALFVIGCGGGGSSGGRNNDDDDDAPPVTPPVVVQKTTHEKAFTEDLPDGYEGAFSCIGCHPTAGAEVMATGHWRWEGVTENIEGHEAEVHGKTDLLNNFCIAIPSNEPRCTQCHIGSGWKNTSFDFGSIEGIDCLVCHDLTGTYAKDPKAAGAPVATVDLDAVAMSVGKPTRKNCGDCHFFAGGGDNVKHGDLSSHLVEPTREMDVHMDAAGMNFSCQKCHKENDHGIAGMPLHSGGEGQVSCADCHGDTAVHGDPFIDSHLERIACQTCHIPAFSRSMPTKMEWYWDEAGQDIDPIPTDKYGKPTYDKKKGRFVWGKSVKPDLRWFNGKWKRMIIDVSDDYDDLPAIMAEPMGDRSDPTAKIYPFKRMIGRQPADTVNKIIVVPHLFGTGPGPNPYWGKFDWAAAVAEGTAYAGQNYSGTYGFVDTVMYLSLNHEIAPKEQALKCGDCHAGGIDFKALGYDDLK
jgi:octaheme c-type cytochrome (tetrathionate reductase family)